MSLESCLRGRAAARRSRRIEDLFDQYLDHVLDGLVVLGVDPAVAMDTIFTAAAYLFEQGALPAFPDKRSGAGRMGAWMLAAGAFDFATFMEKSVIESIGAST